MLKKILVITVVTLLFSPFISNAVSAEQIENPLDSPAEGKDQGPGVPGGEYDRQKREVTLDKYSKKALVTSSWEEEDTQEELKFSFECDKGFPRFDIDYRFQEDSKKADLSFGVVFEEVFEFRDMNLNGRYDEKDQKVSRHVLGGSDFVNIKYERAQNGYRYRTRTVNSNFSLEVRGSREFMNYGSQTINPSETKIDIAFDYDLEAEDSRLGLKISIENRRQVKLGDMTYDEEKGYAEGESWIRLEKGDHTGFFSWSDSVEVDGKELPANANFISQRSIKEGGSMSKRNDTLYLSYPSGKEELVHDPKIGVVGASALPSSSSEGSGLSTTHMSIVLVATVAASAVIFSAGVYIRKKY